MNAASVEAFRQALDPQARATVDALRALAAAAHPALTERIKWDAPSFAIGEEDRITLGIERKGGVQVVLHRGAKAKDTRNFVFADPAGLAKWPASDRAVMVFADAGEVAARREEIGELFGRWIAATVPAQA